MSQAADAPTDIVPLTLDGGYGTLAAWEAVPPPGVDARGTVVLVPGFTGSKEDFAAMLPLLAAAGYRAVAYDQRGQWQSDGPDQIDGYTMDDFSGDLLKVVDQVSGQQPVHLVGHSFGGYVARVAVVARPERFRTLTLLASGPSSVSDINFPPPSLVAQAVEAGGQEFIWQQMSSALFAADSADPARIDFLHQRILATKKANILGILQVMEVPPLADPSVLRAAGVPILVAYGDTGDLWNPEVHERFAAALGAHRAVYPGVGHLPNEDRPAQVCTDLVAFWNHPTAQ
ncbi:alpha/beta fold hydrolase [Nocardia otitidiscaviarum]|uniref:alpha/beta fold hydrolase n=1 Tax=Nocardia otitidiscaviarum TaxID=1823 RepID=UPI0018937CE4|nr:alpha/beta hydrolase [Nocardia otitidiscaviarum]MBF6183597.1 alpha/beta hydrolase [Nocardia otitidiscaviarum]